MPNPLDEIVPYGGADYQQSGDTAVLEPPAPPAQPVGPKQNQQNRLKASDLAARGIPTFRNASGDVSEATDLGTARPASPPVAEPSQDPFADLPTGPYQSEPPEPPIVNDVQATRMQAAKDKAVARESQLIGQKLSIEHADLVSGDKEHSVMTKELQAAVPTLQDPKYAGADRETVLGGIDEHFNSEYARPEANATNGWFSKDLAPSAEKFRADIDQRKAAAYQKANDLFDLKDKQLALGDQVATDQSQRKAQIETLIAHGRGELGPLDLPSHEDLSPDKVRVAAQSGQIPPNAAPAAIAAAHDAEDAQKKATSLEKTNPTLADQFKAVAQGILHGLATGIADVVKGVPGAAKAGISAIASPEVANMVLPQFIRDAYATAGQKIQAAADSDYDKSLQHTVGGKIGNFVGGALPFIATSILPGGAAISVPATVGALFSAGYGATHDDAIAHGASPEAADALGLASGTVNGVLGLPFRGIGGAITRVFGGSSPQIIRQAVEGAFQREGPAGAAKLIDELSGYVRDNVKPVIGNVAQDVRGQVVEAIDNIKGEMLKTAGDRALTVAKHMATGAAIGGGVQTAQNIIAQQYDPERGTFEGVPEQALGFGALSGVFHGWDQVVAARRAKQALDLLRPGEQGPPAVRGEPAGPTPPPQGPAGPTEKPISGRVVEPTPTGGTENARNQPPVEGQIQQGQVTEQPARREGAVPQPDNANAPGATGAPSAVAPAGAEPAGGGRGGAGAEEVTARPGQGAKPTVVPTTVDQAAHQAATSPTNGRPEPSSAQKEAGNYKVGPVAIGPEGSKLQVSIENPAGSQRSNLDSGKLNELANKTVLKVGTDYFGPAQDAVEKGDYVKARERIRAAGDALARQQPELAKQSDALLEGTYAHPLQSHYGYIKGTVGADKDHVDVFVKQGTPLNYDGPVYVVDQTHSGGEKFYHGGSLIAGGGKFDEHKAIIGAGSHEEAIAEYQKNYDPEHQGNYSGVTEFKNIGDFKQWLDSGVKGPAAESKGVVQHPTNEAQNEIGKQVMDRMQARKDVLDALTHPTTPRAGKTTNDAGIQTIGGQITVDVAKLVRATEGMPERQRTKFIDRAIDEEIIHVAQDEWAHQDPANRGLVRAWGAEKDDLDAHMADSYEGWEKLNDEQKGFEKQRAVLQKRWTGRLTEAAYRALQAFLRFLRGIWEKLSLEQRTSIEQVEAMMKGQVPEETRPPPKSGKELAKTLPKFVDTFGKTHTLYGYGVDVRFTDMGGGKMQASGSGWEWYAFSPIKGDVMEGFVHGFEDEWGSFSKSELKDAGVRFITDPEKLAGIAPPIGWERAPYRVSEIKPKTGIEGAPQTQPGSAAGVMAIKLLETATFADRRVRRQELESALGRSNLPTTTKAVVRTLLQSGPKKEPGVMALNQALRKLQGGSHAPITGKEPKSGEPEHIGVPPRTNVPTHEGEIREGQGGRPGGGGKPVERPATPEVGPATEAPAEKPSGRPSGVPGLAVPDDVAQALRDLAEGLGAAAPVVKGGQLSLSAALPIAQKQLPEDKMDVALKAARTLANAGFNTPEKFAGALPAVLHPYAQSLWDIMAAIGKVPRGTHDWNALLAPKQPEKPAAHPITQAVQERLVSGKAFPRTELTALANQHGVSTKEADEYAEAGVVRAAREVVLNHRVTTAKGENADKLIKASVRATFDELVEMYENQPNLTAKTATSKIAQALSTPIPIAYLASRLADIAGGKVIYEPTAGNGALLIEADPATQDVHANELNSQRAAELKSQGFKVTSNDATDWRPPIKADRMIENPPFGTMKEESGEGKTFDVQGLETTQIDHAITLASLEALADDGRAVLIVGGPGTGTGDVIADTSAREKYYYEGQRGDFWKKLYTDNEVIDHFTIDGDLYEKQGAGWPIDMVVIKGVGKSPIRLPSANAPRIINSWDDLRNELGRTDAERIAAGKLGEREAADQISGAISGIRNIVGPRSGSERPRLGSPVTGGPKPGGSPVVPEISPAEQPELAPAGGTETSARPAVGPARGAVTGEPSGEHEQRGQLGVEGEGYPEPDLAKYRVPYKPKSGHPSFDIFTPTNLEHPQQVALKKVAEAVGDIDEYVREKLGYTDKEKKLFRSDYFSAEQIDTLALAIHAAEKGSAFITGDQGGVGKGRIAAGMMLYAIKRDWIPVFMTRDEKLYAAMLEDLDDIGRGDLVPLFTNNGMRFEDHRKQVWRTGNQSVLMNQIRDSGELPKDTQLLFTSYYQVQNDVPRGWNPGRMVRASLKARKEAPPDGPRMEALKRIAPNALFIMDESHEASGDSIRAWRLEPLLSAAPAAYYSSATFAKRPDSVGIYFRTTLSHAAPNMSDLIEALSTGGVPLQQAAISMLADDGLYMRRERDFGKTTFNTHINLDSADRDKDLADTYTGGLRKILGLSNSIAQIVEHINGIIKGQGKRFGSASAPRLESTNFAAIIHNLVSQYLLSIKSKVTVERAIHHIKEGRRVVVTVQNTMESAIRALRASGLPLNFNGLLQRLLEKQRTLTTGGRNPEEFYISDEPNPEFEQYSDKQLEGMLVRYETDEEGQRVGVINGDAVTEYFRRQALILINETKEFIDGVDLGGMPLSPIDYMRHAMEDAGYKTAEITGRGVGINRGGEVYEIKGYERSKKAQLEYMRQFNDGPVQFLVMNASGSTGISLHSSKKFKNQDQRAMLNVQPHLDINQFMQSLWRIDRTGQVEPPYFEVVQTAIPAELRPAAVRERKMASLNANTTSNAKNEMRAQDLDIFNEFGDEVVYQYLLSDPGFVNLLQWNAILDKNGNLVPWDSLEMEAGKLVAGVTGRLAILPTAEGEEFWRQVNELYRSKIKYLDDTGQNTLRVASIDMRAETLSSKNFTEGNPAGDSAFDGPSVMEHVKAQFGKAPRMGTDVLEKANEVTREAPETMAKWEAASEAWYQKEIDRRVSLEMGYLTDAEREEAKTEYPIGDSERLYAVTHKMGGWTSRMTNAREEISNALRLLGETVHIHNDRGLDVYGAIVSAKLDDEHPMTPSRQEFTVWVNSTMRQIRLSAVQLDQDAKTTPRDHFVDAYEETAERSNERYIITGNLLAANVSLANQVQNQRIIVYTDDKGTLKQGILLPANFNPNTFIGREEVTDAQHFQQLIEDGRTVTNRNQSVMIMKKAAGSYELRVPASKTSGEKFWGNHTLRMLMNGNDFIQKGSQMVGIFGKSTIGQVWFTLTGNDRLATQLFFNRPMSDTGTTLGAAAPRFARDYWTEDVKPTIANAGATMREVVDAAVHVLSPTYGVNKDVVDQVHKLLGERNQVAYVVDQTGEAFERMFRSMPRPDQITFIDRVKTGEPQPTLELEEAARFIRGIDTNAWQSLHDAAIAAGFKESPVKWLDNHYRVMWKKIPGDEGTGGRSGLGKRPLRGTRGMAKQHTLEDMSEGIERGGVPFSYNPITNLKMALSDIWKYTTALKMWAWAKQHGFVSFVRGPFPKLPEGMTWLDDPIADVWFPAESGEGLVHGGKYAVDPGFGRLINNFLSRDLVRQTKTGRGLLWIKNATTALELALSLFHGVFETGEVIGSNIGLGLSKLYNRGLLQKDTSALMSGMMDLIKAAASPVNIATLGAAFRKAAGRPDEFWQSAPGKEFLKLNPDARELIDYLFSGGWKPNEVEADWKNKSVRSFVDAVADLKTGTSTNYIGAGLRAFPAANEFLMGPLFDVYIPNLKVGQFVTEMREALRQADLKYGSHGYYVDRQGRRYDRPTNAELARKVWRFIEDRFGELNYDTLFWNNTFKSAMQLMFRSVTWKLGSVEAFAGAFGGQGKEFINAFKERRAPELHRNTAWLFGIFLLTAALGTVISTVLGGHKPQNPTDLVFPRIDPKDPRVRVSIPTYFKDLVHLVHSPVGYVKASLAGWIGRVADLLVNKDYYGVQIRNTDDPATKQALQMGRYAAQTLLPFSIRGYKNLSSSQENTLRKSMALLGINPAPRYIGQTPAEQQVEKFWKGQRSEEGIKPEQFEAQKEKRELVSKIRKGISPDISGALAAGKLKPNEVSYLYKRASLGQLASSIDKMPLEEAEKVYAKANPEERAQLASIISRKRAGSLRRSGRTMYAGF